MEKYGLIGYPLRHSFSIGYFNEKFRSEGINAEYVNFEIPNINDFMEVIEENPNLCGLNVTIPYKEQVIPFLNELDRDTAKIGAVNVIKIIRQPKRKSKNWSATIPTSSVLHNLFSRCYNLSTKKH